jgi:uncharacterized membrane protein YeiH
LTIPATLLLDLIGTAVFALSGALLAVRKDYDIVGVAVLSIAAGLGGGMLRDLLLGDTPPAGLADERYLATAGAAALLGFLFHPGFARLGGAIRLFDAVGLGFFAVSGTLKSLEFGLDPVPAVLLGVLTGVGGGAIRDILALDTPMVLRQDIYALAALLGATVFVVADRYGIGNTPAAAIGVLATVLLRLVSMRFNWHAPRPRR